MLILGIDPGSSGGLAIIKNSNNTLPTIILALRMPTVTIYGKIIDTKKIATELQSHSIDVSIIEKVLCHYKASAFNLEETWRNRNLKLSFLKGRLCCSCYLEKIFRIRAIWKESLDLAR